MTYERIPASRILLQLSEQKDRKDWAFTLCDFVARITGSHLVCYFGERESNEANQSGMPLIAKVGLSSVPKQVSTGNTLYRLARENRRLVVQTGENGPFPELLLGEKMRSGAGMFIASPGTTNGFLVANHGAPFHYNAEFIGILEQLGDLVRCNRGEIDG